jgi:hypothetical protein
LTATSDAFARALDLIATASRNFAEPWAIIGSAAARLSGAYCGVVADIDLLLGEEDARALIKSWAHLTPTPAPVEDSLFRSRVFARFVGAPLPIEAMAGFSIRYDGLWRDITPGRRRVAVGGLMVQPVDDQIALLELMNRPKDRLRIDALRRIASKK